MKIARSLGVMVAAVSAAATMTLVAASPAQAYAPLGSTVYQLPDTTACLKGRGNCAVYPKTTQLPGGRLLMSFEQATVPASGTTDGETLPIYSSDDYGDSWQKLSDVKAPAYLSNDPQYAQYTSAWTNPDLYVLPQQVGTLAAGTVVLAAVVSGQDYWYTEHKAADPNYVPDNDGDRANLAIALYTSPDKGKTWNFLNIVAKGGWQGGSAGAFGRFSSRNTNHQTDPVWEPFLLAYKGQLICYYSDENDYTGYDPTTGVATLDPANDTAQDSVGQILAHRTWNGTTAGTWGPPIVDTPGLITDMGNGKTELGGGRPGMTTVTPTTDGKWMMTFEYFGGGINVRYKIATDPTDFRDAAGDPNGTQITSLPVSATSSPMPYGGSPVIYGLPDGRIAFNAIYSGDVWINESGRSDGTWTEYGTNSYAAYSRTLQYVDGTGKLAIVNSQGTSQIVAKEVDFGNSDGTYYRLVNKATGQALGTSSKTQDARLTGGNPDVVMEKPGAAIDPDTQYWHLANKSDGGITLLNKSGGRSASVWGGNAAPGTAIGQWVDNTAGSVYKTITNPDGFVKFQATTNSSVYLTGGAVGTAATLQNATADGSQDWQLVPLAPHATDLTATTRSTALISAESVAPGSTVTLDASAFTPAGTPRHVNTAGNVYALSTSGSVTDLGTATFGVDQKAIVKLPASLLGGQTVSIAVTFAQTPLIWDTVRIGSGAPAVKATLTSTNSPRNGWYDGSVTATLTATAAVGTTIQYQVDGGSWKKYTKPFTLSTDGPHTVGTRLLAGVAPVDGSTMTFPVAIDTTAPTVQASATPTAVGSPRNPITVIINASDKGSGVASTQSSTDGGSWTTTTGPLTVSKVGSHVIAYRAVDKAGNQSNIRSIRVIINPNPATVLTVPARVIAGGFATYTVTGFQRYSWVTITLGTTELTTVLTDANGTARFTTQIPATAADGPHTVTAVQGIIVASASELVNAPLAG